MGVVYYANYFIWFEVGRCDLLRTLGWNYRDIEAGGISLPVIAAECEYRHPMRYDERVDAVTRGTVLSPVRIEFRYEIVRPADGSIAAVGRTVHAVMSAQGRPRRLPDEIRAAFA